MLRIIQQSLKRNNIERSALPDYLAFAHLESNFDPHVASSMGAAGLFQLMPGTAHRLAMLHPGIPSELTIYNPIWRSGRPLLQRGPAARYPVRILRWYSEQLRKRLLELRQQVPDDDHRALRLTALDSRFDPTTNATLATFYVELLRKRHFGRYRCFATTGGPRVCGRFGKRDATIMAAACFHLGAPLVERLVARSGAWSSSAYIRAALGSHNRSYVDNGRYLLRLQRRARTYRRLIVTDALNPKAVTRAFGDATIARNLFATWPAPEPVTQLTF